MTKGCPACKKEVPAEEMECLHCGIIFDKWDARASGTSVAVNMELTPVAAQTMAQPVSVILPLLVILLILTIALAAWIYVDAFPEDVQWLKNKYFPQAASVESAPPQSNP